jgi:O-antigen/teichoic acid export membrane protein
VAGFGIQAPPAIMLAVVGGGPYSVAVGQDTGALVTGVLVFVLVKVPVRIGFDPSIAGKLVGFGVPLAASLGVEAILVNANYVIVGRLMGAAALGFYLLAFSVSTWALGVIITGVRYVSIPPSLSLPSRRDRCSRCAPVGADADFDRATRGGSPRFSLRRWWYFLTAVRGSQPRRCCAF